jgi:hypothetical protein
LQALVAVMLAQMGAEFLEIDQSNLQEENECGPCLLFSATAEVCGEFERPLDETARRKVLAVALYAADVTAVLGLMSEAEFGTNQRNMEAKLNDTENTEKTIICDHHGFAAAARMKRISSNTVCIGDLRQLMTRGSKIKGSSLALPYLALPCLALPCLALPCLPCLPCLALLCLSVSCRVLPCRALPCLAMPLSCLALPCLALSSMTYSRTFMHTRDVVNYYYEILTQISPDIPSLFIAPSYFYHKAAGHSCCFYST